jgi:aspartyl-tRNA synthetase
MEISDITEEMRTLGLEGFPAAIEAGAVARAIVLPASGGISGTRLRKINEELWLTRIVPDARAAKKNLFTLKYTDEAIANLIKKGASEEVARKIFSKTGAQKDDTILVGVDAEGPIAMAMGILRLEMGKELKLINEKDFKFLWIVDFPLFDWDAGEKRFYSVNHPFTAVLPEDAHMLDAEPGKVRAKAYDIVLNGMEVGGGSYRIHDSATQAKVFKILGLTDEETRDRFGFFIDALSYGTPPHGGIALGLDRLAMLLSGAASLRDVIAFPKTASATDLMCNAPSKVKPEQLRDLGILLSKQ